MEAFGTFVFSAALALGSATVTPELPNGWRLPQSSDYFNASVALDFSNPVVADFFGTGDQNPAYLLVHSVTGEGAIFVSSESFTLARVTSEPVGVADYSLSVLGAGDYLLGDEAVRFPGSAILVREVEFGTGTVHWFSGTRWMSAHVSVHEPEFVAE